jgi:hypothetical protein
MPICESGSYSDVSVATPYRTTSFSIQYPFYSTAKLKIAHARILYVRTTKGTRKTRMFLEGSAHIKFRFLLEIVCSVILCWLSAMRV